MSKRKFIIIWLIVIGAVLVVTQIPPTIRFFRGMGQGALEKRDNAIEEYQRVKKKVDHGVNKAIETKEKVEDAIDTANETIDKAGEIIEDIDETIEDVQKFFNDDEAIICTEDEKVAEICTMDYTPVCGDDGVTYGNACGACSSGNIDAYIPGECESVE